MNPLAANLSSASRPTSATAQPVVRNAADAQATLANRLAERLGLEPGALASKANDYTPEKVAGRILGFIEQRLQSEQAAGADPSKLKGLLEQARSGVEKGFAEARKILDGMGVLQGKVASDIDDTYQKIQDGFSDLDKRFNPDAALVEGSTNIAAYSERFAAQAETFDMEVTTRDGDRLRISIAQASANWSQSGVVASSNGNGSSVVASSQSGSLQIGAWQVSVEGELDDEERAALEKLFGQVQDLSNKFYAGDLSGAFDRAMALEMDGEQLASMSLRLTQTTVRQATDAYSAVAQDGGQAASARGGHGQLHRRRRQIGRRPLQQIGRQAFTRSRAQQPQLLGPADQIPASIRQLVARRAVSLVQLLQSTAHLVQIGDKGNELVVQLTSTFGNLARVLALALLAPEAVDHPQGGQQGGRADNHDVAVEGLLEQVRLGLQRSRKRGLDGHEQQHEIQAVQAFQALVVLAGQAFDVISQRQHMLLQGCLANDVILRRHILLIRSQADLGVHHHLLVARQINQHIRLKALTIRPLVSS